uniref:Uncharacterized protein n=1 Tax=Arundo donax TaxID=35708 RepID=A0A0A9EAS9_ARUDO
MPIASISKGINGETYARFWKIIKPLNT